MIRGRWLICWCQIMFPWKDDIKTPFVNPWSNMDPITSVSGLWTRHTSNLEAVPKKKKNSVVRTQKSDEPTGRRITQHANVEIALLLTYCKWKFSCAPVISLSWRRLASPDGVGPGRFFLNFFFQNGGGAVDLVRRCRCPSPAASDLRRSTSLVSSGVWRSFVRLFL